MASDEGQVVLNAALAPPVSAQREAGGVSNTAKTVPTTEPIHDRDASVYASAVRAALPRLRRFLEEPPRFEREVRSIRRGVEPATLYRRLSAATAVGTMLEYDHDLHENELLRECVRISLIHWQLSLRHDGRPVHRRAGIHDWYVVNVDLVVQLLNTTSRFHDAMLLDDVGRHLKWLATGPQQTPWVEAALITALANSAFIVRDTALLRSARRRLATLLSRQSGEGWFPERDGADLGRLSLIVDSFASLLVHHKWQEVLPPIQRAIRFLFAFVHPDGRIGGCYNSCGTSFLSPYGMEIMASMVPEAASLARATRQRCDHWIHDRFTTWYDDLFAVMVPRIVAVSTMAKRRLPVGAEWPWMGKDHFHFPEAGLSVHATDSYHAVVAPCRGGALHVTWRSGALPLADTAVIVAYSHSTCKSASYMSQHTPHVSERNVSCDSILKPFDRSRRPLFQRSHRVDEKRSSIPATADRDDSSDLVPKPAGRYAGLAYDTSARTIRFDDDTIFIRDVVRCRLPCHTVICQAAHAGTMNRLIDFTIPTMNDRSPIYVAGGRHVTIERLYRDGQLIEFRTM